MWDHAAVVANVRTLRERGRHRARAGRGRARLRARRARAGCPRRRPSSRRSSGSSPRARPGRRAGPGDVGPDARAHRSRALHLEPLVREDGPGRRHRGAAPRRRGDPDLRAHRALARRRAPCTCRCRPRRTCARPRSSTSSAPPSSSRRRRSPTTASSSRARPRSSRGRTRASRSSSSPNPDILKELAARKGRAFLVGFAAETNDVRANAAAKLAAKGVDLLVANDVSGRGIGFDADDNQVDAARPLGRRRRAAQDEQARRGRRHPRPRARAARRPTRPARASEPRRALGPMSDPREAAGRLPCAALAETLRHHRDLGLPRHHAVADVPLPRSRRRLARAGARAPGLHALQALQEPHDVAFGSGNPRARLMVVGEGPGEEEDKQGMPFVGRAGQLLTKMLASGRLRSRARLLHRQRGEVPAGAEPQPGARRGRGLQPVPDGADRHHPPAVILALGNFAAQTLLGTKEGITRLRGQGVPVPGERARAHLPSRLPAAQSRPGVPAHGLGRSQAGAARVRPPGRTLSRARRLRRRPRPWARA